MKTLRGDEKNLSPSFFCCYSHGPFQPKATTPALSFEGGAAAVRAGVRSDHGTWLSDRTLSLMRLRGTWFVTNITSASATTFWNSINSPDPILVESRRTMRPLATEVTLRAYKMGIPIVGPTDFTYEPKFDSD